MADLRGNGISETVYSGAVRLPSDYTMEGTQSSSFEFMMPC